MPSLTGRDARHALRALARSPFFALTSLLSLAIGIAATTAIVTLADALLLRPPPGVGEPERLVVIGRTQGGRGFDNFSYPNFVDLRAGARTLADAAPVMIEPRSLSLAGPSGVEPVQGAIVGGSFFSVLEATPARGRFFRPDEDSVPGKAPVAVLSYRLWRDRFGADPAVVGSTITLNGTGFTVVGVAQEGFRGPFVLAPDLWVPTMSGPLVGLPATIFQERRAVWMMAIARLEPGVPLSAAQAELATIGIRLREAYPEENEDKGFRVERASSLPGDVKTIVAGFMGLLLAVSVLVLLIAGTNVAGMMLARGVARTRELAVRAALGASRARLAWSLLLEGLILSLAAFAVGVLGAQWLVAGLMALVPRLPVQLAIDPTLDARVLAVSLVIALACGTLTALVPALRTSRPALVPALKSDTAGGGSRLRLRSGLLVAQVAMSMLLLVTAGLFARALARASTMDPGFDPRDVHVASLDLGLANLDSLRGRQLVDRLEERVRGVPGVERVAMTAMLPLDGGGLGLGAIQVAGRPAPEPRFGWTADWNVVTPGYFDVLRIPIVSGRAFTDADRAGMPDVAIVNETFARRLWPQGGAVGRTFDNDGRTVTIVGVARDARYRTLGEKPLNFVYVPLAQRYFERTSVLVRTAPGVTVAPAVRRAVAELAPALPVLQQKSMEEQTAISLFPQRVALWVAGSLGAVALVLALLGIYGVTAYSVERRTREIGIRAALGATRARVLGLVLRQGIGLAAGGIAVGALLAAGATRVLGGVLYGVGPVDPLAFGGAALLLVAAALAASWLPARRAAAVEPSAALRVD